MSESFRPELPARLTFATDIDQIHTNLVSEALAASTKIPEEEKQDWTHYDQVYCEGAAPVRGLDMAKVREAAVPGNILGSEQVFVSSIGDVSTHGAEAGTVKHLSVELLQDGSPYVPEEDMDSAERGSQYTVLAFPDSPPVMIKNSYLQTQSRAGLSYVEKLMQAKAETPDKLHELSDEECRVLMDSVQQFHVNMDDFESIAGKE